MRGLHPVGLCLAGIGTFLVVLFSADVADPLAFCPRPICSPGIACLYPVCAWNQPWVWVFAGVAVTAVAVGLVVLSWSTAWGQLRGWAVLFVGVAALPFVVIGLIIELPSSVPWAPAFLVIGLGAVVVAAVILGLSKDGVGTLHGPG